MNNPIKRRSKFTSVNVQEVHSNIDQEVIEITTDKLKIILKDHIEQVQDNKDWQVPLGILITIVIVFCTSGFKDFAGLSAETWFAIFIVSAIICTYFFIRALLKISKSITIDELIDKIKNKA